jgi:hypothetical protein
MAGEAPALQRLLCVDNLAADNRHLAPRRENLGRGNFHEVGGEDGEVGELADVDLALGNSE